MSLVRLRLLALVWNWIARPASDVSLAYEEAEGRLQKALVSIFSPALFMYYLMFQTVEVSPYTCLHDLPPARVYEMRRVAGEWVPFTRTFNFQELAGEPVIILNIATRCSEIDANYDDLRDVQMYLAANGFEQLRVLGFPCNQFLRQTPESVGDVCNFVQDRGASMVFFDKVKVNGRDASPVYTFLKQASGDTRPIEWNFVKFLVGPDGRTVKRYSPLTLVSEIVGDLLQMRVAADDIDYLPTTFDSLHASNVPVTGRWRRRLNPAANAQAVQAVVTAAATLALFLYPACAASHSPPKTSSVDGVLLACAIVIFLEATARLMATALPYSLASLRVWVGIFTSFSLALDISFIAGAWAERQTHWKILTAIRAARVARVIKFSKSVLNWRQANNWTAHVRFPDARVLTSRLFDSTMLKIYLLVVVSAMIAAPYLQFDSGKMDEVASAMAAIDAVGQGTVQADRLGLFNGTGLYETTATLFAARVVVLCSVADAAGPAPILINDAQYNMSARCDSPTAVSATPLSPAGEPGPFITRQSGVISATFSVRDMNRNEGVSTLVMIAYTIAATAALALAFAENVDREVVRPLEWVSSMLSMKTAEAYNTLKRALAIDESVEANMEPTERIMYQLSRLVLCFRSLAYSQKEEALMDRFLAGEDGTIDQATRQWLMGQTGQILNDTAIESAGLQFVLARQSTTAATLSRMSSTGLRGAGGGGPGVNRNSTSHLSAIRAAAQGSGRDDAGLINRLSVSGFLPFVSRSNRSEMGLPWGAQQGAAGGANAAATSGGSQMFEQRDRDGSLDGPAAQLSKSTAGLAHVPAHVSRRGSNGDDALPPASSIGGGGGGGAPSSRDLERRRSLPSGAGGNAPVTSPVAQLSARNAQSAPRQVRRELLQPQHSSAHSSVSILEGLAAAWTRSKRESERQTANGDRRASADAAPEKSGSVHGANSTGGPAGLALQNAAGGLPVNPGSIQRSGSDRASGDAPATSSPTSAAPAAAGGGGGGGGGGGAAAPNGPWRANDPEPWVGPLPIKDPSDYLKWGVDLFEFGPMELCRFAFAIFEQLGAVRNGYCSPLTLWMFIVEVSNCYHTNPFHNFRHAVDVLQTMAHFLKTVEHRKFCSPLEMFVLAVAALCHDMDHPGVTNAFLINTSDHLALLYNDSSVLENHHVSSLFRLFAQKPAVNVLSRCDRETLKGIRKILLEVVLHTDMSKHFGMVSKAELFAELHMGTIALAARGDPGAAQRLWTKGEDRTFAMALLLHAADVSNPAKPLEIQEKWANTVMQEFFRQGDREAELGLPISPGFDRRTASLPSSQLNFIEFVVMPLYCAVVSIFPEFTHALTHLQRNYADYVERELAGAAAKSPPPPEPAGGGAAAQAQAQGQGPDMPALLKRRSLLNRKAEQGLANAARALAKAHPDLVGVIVDAEGNPVPGPPGAKGSRGGGNLTPGRGLWSAAAQRMSATRSQSRIIAAWKSDMGDREKGGLHGGGTYRDGPGAGGGGPRSPSVRASSGALGMTTMSSSSMNVVKPLPQPSQQQV